MGSLIESAEHAAEWLNYLLIFGKDLDDRNERANLQSLAASLRDAIEAEREAPQPAPALPVEPSEEAEQFIQAAIDRAPEPLRRLGEWLTHKLDDDDWKTADRLISGAAYATDARTPEWRVPDGWKLVPVKPTSEMMDAARDAFWSDEADGRSLDPQEYAWDAALAASPLPPEKEGA